MAENIQTVSISRETHERYLRYALSVITSRALPDVRDGLKPVQRRILYAMHNDLRLPFDGRPAKCARIVGDTMGKYHPHGDSAIYEALVRMAQDWVMRVPLVHGQGNFGSVEGDPPAAYRYTEAKLSLLADYLLRELRQQTVDMRFSYNNENEEPVVLPAEYPNLLVNGSTGIAVGMATNMPPHNPGEVIRAAILLIDDPEASTAEITQRIKGPDFPLGGKIVTDRATLRKIYEEGEGSIKIQGEWKLEGEGTKKPQIVIFSFPYAVEQGKLENQIGTIIETKRLPQALGLTNESSEKDGIRIVVDLKPGSDPNMVMAYLYKHTDLQQNFAYNMTCLIPTPDGQVRPERIGVRALLKHFLDFRLATVRKRFEYELGQLRKRIHILEAFRIVFDALDEAIALIRQSKGKGDAAEKLKERFALDDVQTDAILDAQLYKIASMEIKKIIDELKEKTRLASEIDAILASEVKLWAVIKDELTALLEKLPGRRKSRMATDEDVLEFDEEAYIVRENTNVVLTKDGYIKRVGRLSSVESTRVREGDEVIAVAPGSTLDHVIFFADDGTAYTLRMHDVPASSGYGEPITKYFKIADQVKIIAAESTDERFTIRDYPGQGDDPAGPYLLALTSGGMVLRTPLSAYRTASTKSGRKFVRLQEGEKVVLAQVVRQQSSMLVASREGHLIHFPIEQVSVLSGAGKGVTAIKLHEKDRCLGGRLVSAKGDVMVVETNGGVNKEYRAGSVAMVSRGGRGVEVVERASFAQIVPEAITLTDWDAVESGRFPKPAAPPVLPSAPKSEKPSRNGHASTGESGTLFE